uniref:Reverse transcriptase/retrotransposon-derived protein RNase H-like domain-containing protein n=1 Tax=Chenopodium quinoa TaxID=63459 RepID=A0A803L0A2_CHEQI
MMMLSLTPADLQQLKALKQTGSIQEYHDAFDALASRLELLSRRFGGRDTVRWLPNKKERSEKSPELLEKESIGAVVEVAVNQAMAAERERAEEKKGHLESKPSAEQGVAMVGTERKGQAGVTGESGGGRWTEWASGDGRRRSEIEFSPLRVARKVGDFSSGFADGGYGGVDVEYGVILWIVRRAEVDVFEGDRIGGCFEKRGANSSGSGGGPGVLDGKDERGDKTTACGGLNREGYGWVKGGSGASESGGGLHGRAGGLTGGLICASDCGGGVNDFEGGFRRGFTCKPTKFLFKGSKDGRGGLAGETESPPMMAIRRGGDFSGGFTGGGPGKFAGGNGDRGGTGQSNFARAVDSSPPVAARRGGAFAGGFTGSWCLAGGGAEGMFQGEWLFGGVFKNAEGAAFGRRAFGRRLTGIFFALWKKPIIQDGEADAAFGKLKAIMTSPPVLALPDFQVPFTIETNASGGLDAVLMQKGHPIAFMCKALSERNLHLSAYERELLDIVYAVKKWQHYLMLLPFVIRSTMLETPVRSQDSHPFSTKVVIQAGGSRGVEKYPTRLTRSADPQSVKSLPADTKQTLLDFEFRTKVNTDGSVETYNVPILWRFNHDEVRKALAHMLIVDELPFAFVEREVDNASSNDLVIKYLKKIFNLWDGCVLNCECLHMRCAAHILNLVVKDDLKDVNVSVLKIRAAVKYVRFSPSRLLKFKSCVEEENITCKGLVCLDIETRELMKQSMGGAPDDEDWDKIESFLPFLEIFYNATLKLFGSRYVTGNTFVEEIYDIGYTIDNYAHDPNEDVRKMAKQMKLKFE